jgi:hypothetical protein
MPDTLELRQIMLSRTLGHFPVSIATSLALEVAYGTGTAPEEKPTTVNELIKYDEVWINLRTLARNIYNSVPSIEKDGISAKDIAAALDQEMTSLHDIPQSMGDSKQFKYYYCKHEHLEKKMRHAQFRIPSTAKQLHQADVTAEGIVLFIKTIRKREKEVQANSSNGEYQSPLTEFELAPKPEQRNAVVLLTHHMLDFLNYPKFKTLTLLESHTGALKGRDRWYTKFVNGRELDFMPFNAATLQLFGDTEMFKPFKDEVRKEIQAIAKDRAWNPSTTDERFLLGLSLSKNKFLADTVKDMLRSI